VEGELVVGTLVEGELVAGIQAELELSLAVAADLQSVRFAGHPCFAAALISWPCDGPLNRQLRPPRRLLRVVFF